MTIKRHGSSNAGYVIATPTAEHQLIYNVVKTSLPLELSELQKNAIALQVAIRLRGLVRVKEMDE